MSLVLDASAMIAWLLDEPEAAEIGSLIAACEVDPGQAPSMFAYEVANGVSAARLRRRIEEADAPALLALAGSMPIRLIPFDLNDLGALYDLSRDTGLAVYDAAYLLLALRAALPLATLDRKLAAAARARGVALAI